MPDWLPAVIVGCSLIVLAAGLAWYHWTAWKFAGGRGWSASRSPGDAASQDRGFAQSGSSPGHPPDDDATLQHAWRQLRRRLQVSGFLAAIGVMIPLGDVLPIFRNDPLLFVIFWFVVLGLVVWMVLLVLGDLASNLAFNREAQAQLDIERRKLEHEIQRFRSEGNGHESSKPGAGSD